MIETKQQGKSSAGSGGSAAAGKKDAVRSNAQKIKDTLKGMGYDAGSKELSPRRADPEAAARKGTEGPGSPLPYKDDMEKAFGADLSGVKAHTGPKARGSAQAMGANAYAKGNDVAFGTAEPDRALVGHEVAHTIQQSGGATPGVQQKDAGGEGDSGSSAEVQADAAGKAVAAGKPVASAVKLSPKAVTVAKDDFDNKDGSGTSASRDTSGLHLADLSFTAETEAGGDTAWRRAHNYAWTCDSMITDSAIHIAVGAETIATGRTQEVDGRAVPEVDMPETILTKRDLKPEDLSADQLLLFMRWYDRMKLRYEGGPDAEASASAEDKAFLEIADQKGRLMARTVMAGLQSRNVGMMFPDGTRFDGKSSEQDLAAKMMELLFRKADFAIGEQNRDKNDWAANFHWLRSGDGDYMTDDKIGDKDGDPPDADRDPTGEPDPWMVLEGTTPGHYTSRLIQQARPGVSPGLIQVVDHKPYNLLQHNRGDERIWRVEQENDRTGVERREDQGKSHVFLEYQYVQEGGKYFIVFFEQNSGLSGRVEVQYNAGKVNPQNPDWTFTGPIMIEALPQYLTEADRTRLAADMGNRQALYDAIMAAVHTDTCPDPMDRDENMQAKEAAYGNGIDPSAVAGSQKFVKQDKAEMLVADWGASSIHAEFANPQSYITDDRIRYYAINVRFRNGTTCTLLLDGTTNVIRADPGTAGQLFKAPYPIDNAGGLDLEGILNRGVKTIDRAALTRLVHDATRTTNTGAGDTARVFSRIGLY